MRSDKKKFTHKYHHGDKKIKVISSLYFNIWCVFYLAPQYSRLDSGTQKQIAASY